MAGMKTGILADTNISNIPTGPERELLSPYIPAILTRMTSEAFTSKRDG